MKIIIIIYQRTTGTFHAKSVGFRYTGVSDGRMKNSTVLPFGGGGGRKKRRHVEGKCEFCEGRNGRGAPDVNVWSTSYNVLHGATLF